MSHKKYSLASYCSSPAWGGLEMNVLMLLRWMKERGWPVRFYGDPATRMFREAIASGIPATGIMTRLRAGDLVNAWRLSRAVRRDQVRWLTVNRSPDMFMGVFAKLFAHGRTRLIFSQHMHIGTNKKDPYHAWLYRRFDAVETPVRWLADRVLEKTTVPPARLHVVTRGVEIDRFTAHRPDRDAARKLFGLPLDQPVLGLVGRLDPKKGQDVAVEALVRLKESGCRPHLLLVGDRSHNEWDEFEAGLHGKVAALGMEDQIHFFPHRSDIEWVYAALDIFLMASKSECYGMVTIEALLSGVPVIGSNDGGTVDLIQPGRNGLLVEPRNAQQLADAISTLLDDPDALGLMGENARKDAIVRFSHVRQCEEWEKLLETLA
jgi:glycosyltransferase involved in cell wall biosynthesis